MKLAESLSVLLYLCKNGEPCKYGMYLFSYPKIATLILRDAYDKTTMLLSQVAAVAIKRPVTAISFVVNEVDADLTKLVPYIPREINDCINVMVDGENITPDSYENMFFTRFAITVKKLANKNYSYAGTLFLVGDYKPFGGQTWLRRLRAKRMLKKQKG